MQALFHSFPAKCISEVACQIIADVLPLIFHGKRLVVHADAQDDFAADRGVADGVGEIILHHLPEPLAVTVDLLLAGLP